MRCPVDGETLVMTERSGVEIDYCPKCRGVWLDRGELDKIVARSDAGSPAPTGGMAPVSLPQPEGQRFTEGRYRGERQHEGRRDRHDDDDDDRRYRGKRREGFLSDLFDF